MGHDKIRVEVAYASVDTQKIVVVEVLSGATIENVIRASGILEFFPEIDLGICRVGIFSKVKKLTDIVRDGERVEIYRELVINPKEARRMRVKKK